MKNENTNPKKGTQIYEVIQLLKRVQGATVFEIKSYLQIKDGGDLNLPYLRDMCGYDIRRFCGMGVGRTNKKCSVFRIVGRWEWNGDYESYVGPTIYQRRSDVSGDHILLLSTDSRTQ